MDTAGPPTQAVAWVLQRVRIEIQEPENDLRQLKFEFELLEFAFRPLENELYGLKNVLEEL